MTKKIAIACQGGASHTAFTAGVLKRILKENKTKYEIIGLSGTSGGAICAALAWCGLLKDDRNLSIKKLDAFWMDNSAYSLWDSMVNYWIVQTVRMKDKISAPEISPYDCPEWAHDMLEKLLKEHLDFDKIRPLIKSSSPKLLIGAADVRSGKFKVFKNEENSIDSILASAAVPTLFRAVNIKGKKYWDGMFSQNPPLREFILDPGPRPNELWVIQINPETRKEEPKSLREITDRRNELSGNLSLNQEIYFIRMVNSWVKNEYFKDNELFKDIPVKCIKMDRQEIDNEILDYASKLNRNPRFIQELMNYGESQAETFLSGKKEMRC